MNLAWTLFDFFDDYDPAAIEPPPPASPKDPDGEDEEKH